MSQGYDFIIIGTGAGGGTVAHELANTGKRILVLERGEFLPREKENWDPESVYQDQRYYTDEEWCDRNGEALNPQTCYWVGGNTKVYGAALLPRQLSEAGGNARSDRPRGMARRAAGSRRSGGRGQAGAVASWPLQVRRGSWATVVQVASRLAGLLLASWSRVGVVDGLADQPQQSPRGSG